MRSVAALSVNPVDLEFAKFDVQTLNHLLEAIVIIRHQFLGDFLVHFFAKEFLWPFMIRKQDEKDVSGVTGHLD